MRLGRAPDHAAAQQQRVDQRGVRVLVARPRRSRARSARGWRSGPRARASGRSRRRSPARRSTSSRVRRCRVRLNWLVFCVSCAARSSDRRVESAHAGAHLAASARSPPARPARAAQLRGLGAGGVGALALAIVRRQRRELEAQARGQRRGRARRAGRRGSTVLTSGSAAATSAHSAGLSSANTIDVEPEPERLGDLGDLLGLAPPVGDERGEVLEAQTHPGVALERLARGLGVVLGRHGEDQPALAAAPAGIPGRRRRPRPRGPRRCAIPSGPSSPTTPPHSVLSRSTTRQRAASPRSAASTAAVSRASARAAPSAPNGCRAAYQRRGSSHAACRCGRRAARCRPAGPRPPAASASRG